MTTPIRVLLIEDNPGDARLIREILAAATNPTFDVVWVKNLTAGIEQLQANQTDISLLDLGLPESMGLETVHKLFSQGTKPPALVVMSGLADEDVAVQAVHSGAQDYLIKG